MGGLWPLKVPLIWATDSAVDFERVNLIGIGVMMSSRFNRNVFWSRECKRSRHVLNDVVRQMREQLRHQIKNPFKRWWHLHWRWYAPLTGGWSASRAVGEVIDYGVHNTYRLPITRFVRFAESDVAVTEVNFWP